MEEVKVETVEIDSQLKNQTNDDETLNCDLTEDDNEEHNDDNNDNVHDQDVESFPFVVTDQSKSDELISEQQSDITLKDCIHQAQLSKGNYYFKPCFIVRKLQTSGWNNWCCHSLAVNM